MGTIHEQVHQLIITGTFVRADPYTLIRFLVQSFPPLSLVYPLLEPHSVKWLPDPRQFETNISLVRLFIPGSSILLLQAFHPPSIRSWVVNLSTLLKSLHSLFHPSI